MPVEPEEGAERAGLFGWLEGTMTVRGDIIAPAGEEWEADG